MEDQDIVKIRENVRVIMRNYRIEMFGIDGMIEISQKYPQEVLDDSATKFNLNNVNMYNIKKILIRYQNEFTESK